MGTTDSAGIPEWYDSAHGFAPKTHISGHRQHLSGGLWATKAGRGSPLWDGHTVPISPLVEAG
eukprot:182023-Alexandrium_andersonii.AAC.1